MKSGLAIVAALGLVSTAIPASAGDGRFEINQSCIATGCFPGDAAGFPVETQARKSYVLTSSLAIPGADSTAIQLGERATLDLNGFAIEGVTLCSAGSTTTCTETGGGVGVVATGAATVRNGSIRRMGSHGVSGAGALVENVLIEENGGDGVNASPGPAGFRVRDCKIQVNGGNGINLNVGGGGDGALIERNVIRRNGGIGVFGIGVTLVGNSVFENDGYGFYMGNGDIGAYGGNHLNANNGGNGNPQVFGGDQMGTNVCGGDTTCP
jgi:hypothetical protein